MVNQRPKKRRTRKAAYSCDRCKSKKRKCVRKVKNDCGELVDTLDIAYPCTECLKAKALCHTSLSERKYIIGEGKFNHRRISSDEGKDARNIQRVELLGEIISKLYPGQNVSSVSDLRQLLKCINSKIGADHQQYPSPSSLSGSSIDSSADFTTPNVPNPSSSISETSTKASTFMKSILIAQQQYRSQTKPMQFPFNNDGEIRFVGTLSPSIILENIFGAHHNIEDEPSDMKETDYGCLFTRKNVDSYVNVFFNRVYPTHHYIDQNQFAKSYELYWIQLKFQGIKAVQNKVSISPISKGIIYLIWMLGRLTILGDNVAPSKNGLTSNQVSHCLAFIKKILPDAILRPSISGIQFLMLFTLYLELNNRIGISYDLIKLILSQAISVGLHEDIMIIHPNFDERIQKSRSYLWWSIVCEEISLQNYLKCPSINEIPKATVKFPGKYGNFTNEIEYWSEPEDYEDYFESNCNLHLILDRILKLQTKLASSDIDTLDVVTATNIRKDLLSWKHTLSPLLNDTFKFKPDHSSHYKLYLHLCFHHVFASLGLPFLIYLLSMDCKEKIAMKSPLMLFCVSAISCSKQLYNLVNYEYTSHIFNGSVDMDLNILYQGVVVLAIALLLLSRDHYMLDIEQLNLKKNISLESMKDILGKIEDLNLDVEPFTNGTLVSANHSIACLFEDLHSWTKSVSIKNKERASSEIDNDFWNDSANLFNLTCDDKNDLDIWNLGF